MVQRDVAAVGHQPVDELELFGLHRHGAIALVQALLPRRRQLSDAAVHGVLFMGRDHAQAPSRAAEILREGIHTYRVVRHLCHQRSEIRHKGAVHIVGHEHQVRILADQTNDLLHLDRAERHRWRIAGVDRDRQFDLGIFQLGDFGSRVVPVVSPVSPHAAGVDRHDLELEAFEMRDLDIGRERRQEQRDGIALLQQAVLHQRVEDVAHGRRAALDREQVELALGRTAVAHFLDQVIVHHLFQVDQCARRHGIVVADKAVRQLMDPRIGVESLDLHAVLQHTDQKIVAVQTLVLGQEFAEPVRAALLGWHARENGFVAHAARLLHGELPHQEKRIARLGGNPVRIATAGVQHGDRGSLLVFLGQRNQIILQFEGRKLFEVALARAGRFQGRGQADGKRRGGSHCSVLLVCMVTSTGRASPAAPARLQLAEHPASSGLAGHPVRT